MQCNYVKGNCNLTNNLNIIMERGSLTSFNLGMQHQISYVDHSSEVCLCCSLNMFWVSIKIQSDLECSYVSS